MIGRYVSCEKNGAKGLPGTDRQRLLTDAPATIYNLGITYSTNLCCLSLILPGAANAAGTRLKMSSI